MRLLICIFVVFVSLGHANGFEIDKEEAKLLKYLDTDAESLRFRRLYAAESRKNKLLQTSDEGERKRLQARISELEVEAEQATKLGSAIRRLVADQPRADEEKQKRLCQKQESLYMAAANLIGKMKDHDYLNSNVANPLIKSYEDSNALFQAACLLSREL